MSFAKKIHKLISTPSQSRTMGIVMTLILVGAVSLTVTVAQRQQSLRQLASAPVCTGISGYFCKPLACNDYDDCRPTNSCSCTFGLSFACTGTCTTPVATPTPTPAPASCSSYNNCNDCIFAVGSCGWDGNKCMSGASSICPSSGEWHYTNCSVNQSSCVPTPTKIPTNTPTPTNIPTPIPFVPPTNTPTPTPFGSCPTTGKGMCGGSNPPASHCTGLYYPEGTFIPNCPVSTPLCWRCDPPTPTPTISSLCTIDDCGGPAACAVGSSCQQRPGVSTKSCECRPTTGGGTGTTTTGAVISMTVKIDGIPEENASPVRKNRKVGIIVKNPNTFATVKSADGFLNYSSATGLYTGTIDLGTGLPTTPINIVIKMDHARGFSENVTLSQGTNNLGQITVRTGLDDNNNRDAVTYFNSLFKCFNNKKGCGNLSEADVNDDGKVDGIDLNIFLKSIRVINTR